MVRIGPVEVEENGELIWNCIDWPAYIRCNRDCSTASLARVIRRCWQLNAPRLMLVLLSDAHGLNTCNQDICADLASGVIKTATAANVWLITNGLDSGAARLLAASVAAEKAWQKAVSKHETHPNHNCIADCVLLGVVDTDKLTGDPLLQRHMKDLQTLETPPFALSSRLIQNPAVHSLWSNVTSNRSSHAFSNYNSQNMYTNNDHDRHFIDENHTHFIFVSSGSIGAKRSDHHQPVASHKSPGEQILALELLLELSRLSSWIKKHSDRKQTHHLNHWRIPLVALMVQGNKRTAQTCVQYLLRQVPVLVVDGSGGCADLLAYAYGQLNAKFDLRSNIGGLQARAEYIKQVLGPAICTRAAMSLSSYRRSVSYSYVSAYTKLILRCVLLSYQHNICLLHVIPAASVHRPLRNLHDHVLLHYVKCRSVFKNDTDTMTTGSIRHAQLMHDLKLALAWNSCLLMQSLLRERPPNQLIRPCHYILWQALSMGDRHKLICILLKNGFCARHALNANVLKSLMQIAIKSPLFQLLCYENMLGLPLSRSLSTSVFKSQANLILLVNRLFGQAVQLQNFLSIDDLTVRRQNTSACVEQKALLFLSIWSVVTGRFDMVHAFWPLSLYPLHILLLVSKAIDQMLSFSSDFAMRENLHAKSRSFVELAENLLHNCHNKSESVAIKAISFKCNHFSDFTPIEIAAHLGSYSFVAHNSCQKWLDSKLMKGMHVRGTKFGELADGIKLLLCVFFVFPIHFWIDQSSTNYSEHQNQQSFAHFRLLNRWLSLVQAPITKYWMSQLFYIIGLLWFTATVVQSSCGSPFLDCGACIWLMSLHLEGVRCRWLLRKSLFKSGIIQWLEEPLVICFVFIFYLARLSSLAYTLVHYAYHIRMASACVLIYHYLKYMSTFMPMYSTLGPLFYHIRLLSLNDVLSFALLCWPFLVGFGVITEVALYPDRDSLQSYNLQAMIHRTLSSLFKTPIKELLSSNDHCEQHFSHPYENITSCRSAYFDDVNCNHRGVFPVIFFTSYVLLLKIVLLTLLFALFNTSMITLDMLTIWRYQRFQLIFNFEFCNPFPPPLSPIMYLYWITQYLFSIIKNQGRKSKESKVILCNQCSNESMLYFWQSTGKNNLEQI